MKRAAFLPLLLALACTAKSGSDWPKVPVGTERVSIMTFNVENLFDAKHDRGKDDYTFLPKEKKRSSRHKKRCAKLPRAYWREQCLHWDWSEGLVETKLQRVASAILQVGDAKGADVVVLQEVENRAILERLRTEYLGPAEYQPGILIEGGDYRGIDVAILTRLRLLDNPKLHPLKLTSLKGKERDARGILEVRLELPDKTPLTVFAVHLPAPYHPTSVRVQGLKALAELYRDLPKGSLAVAAGDFNVVYAEDLEKDLFKRFAEPSWLVSHRIGCRDCWGTAYYPPKKEWSFLDVILISKNMRPEGLAGWVVLADSVRIANQAAHQKNRDGTPARFDAYHAAGTSDHWPVVLELARKK